MKKLLFFFAAAVCAAAGWAQTSSSLSATVKSQTLEVALTNPTENFVAFQMDITLPEGVTVESEGAVVLNKTRLDKNSEVPFAGAANSDFVIAYNKIDDSTVRVLAYNLKNRAISGTEGELFSMNFGGTTSENFVIDNVKFVSLTELREVELAQATSTSGASYLKGDVDLSGGVDSLDLALLVDIILKKVDPTATSNVDETGDIDSLDLALLVDILLKKI